MWWWLRLFFIFLLWLGVAAGIGLVMILWKLMPGRILGVPWTWYAGSFMLALALTALDISLELPQYPLPPEVTEQEEVERWGYYLGVGIIASVIFVLLVAPLFVVSGWIFRYVEPFSWWVAKILAVLFWGSWYAAVFQVLGWARNLPVSISIRRSYVRNASSDEDFVALLRKAPLPHGKKVAFLKQLKRQGMTKELVYEIQEALDRYMEETKQTPSRSIRYATLQQALSLWLEANEDGSGSS